MSPQSTIAHYRIISKLGEGGMGEVWRATDTKLNRDVAIKILPASFAEDAARMQRFEREAQVLASLNHPNIAAIYGIEQGAIVMELVEGADLAGPLPPDTAIAYARQIIAGLEAAHERGIVHRDLKPANIKVTPEGTVKLLDFGLAKAGEQSSVVASSATMSPTLSLAMTQAGMILGTAAYMSPEQARGKPVDRRSDIWSFGVILYELLTGTMLFGGGETVSDSLAAVITREPDFNALPKDTPPRVRRLLERCLRKDPKLRLRDIGEARILLDEPEPEVSSAVPSTPVERRHSRLWMAAAAVLAVALAAVSAIHFRETPAQPGAIRFQVSPPEGNAFASPFLSLSPDGRRLAFMSAGKAGRQPILWVRTLDSLEARPLPGTEGAIYHFWSPDSRSLAFWSGGKLKKIEASGGPPQALCNVATSTAVTGWWSRDGFIYYANGTEGIFRVPQAGGDPVQVTKPDPTRGESLYFYPQILPDERHYLYLMSATARENSAVYLGSLDGKEKRRLAGTNTAFTYVPPDNSKVGHLLFLREDTLMAQPLDPRTYNQAGDAFPVAERVGSSRLYALFAISPNGTLAFRTESGSASRQLTWFDRSGKSLSALTPPAEYNNVALSRDGTRAAVTQAESQTGNRDVWLIDVARGIPTRFTFDEAEEWDPVWSPDGSRLAFSSRRDGLNTLYVKDASGAAKEERLQKAEEIERPCDWSPDGRFLMYVRGVAGSQKLWFLSDPAGDPAKRKAAPYLETAFNTSHCQFSPGPEGAPRWVAYSSDESRHGREIFVQSFPAGAGKFQVSSGGGTQPRWRRDGKELFYIAPDGKLMAVDVKTGARFESGVPHALFDSHIFIPNVQTVFRYDVTPDGQRFLVNTPKPADAAAPAESITVVVNWPAAVKK